MANPPYSGGVVILKENQDGIDARVIHWDEIPQGTPVPPSPAGLEYSMFSANPTFTAERMTTTRTALIAAFTTYVNAKYPDTQA